MATSILLATPENQYQQGLQAALNALRHIGLNTDAADSELSKSEFDQASKKRSYDSLNVLMTACGGEITPHQKGFITAVRDFIEYVYWTEESPDMDTWTPGELK